MHQTEWQKQLLSRYGNTISLIDATYTVYRVYFRKWLAFVYFANKIFADCHYISHTPYWVRGMGSGSNAIREKYFRKLGQIREIRENILPRNKPAIR